MIENLLKMDLCDPDSFVRFLEANGYHDIRTLEDGSVAALHPLMFTTALHMGLDANGFEYRFCFEDPMRARSELAKLTCVDDMPTGWIARRYGSGGAS
mgnify:CR=1 FL=1